MESRPPLPPFTLETAIEKVQLAENGWNSCPWLRENEEYWHFENASILPNQARTL